MGLETATQTPLGRIDPNSMIGLPEPVVTPSAVAALSDAFRKGVVTSDDIISRYGELAKTKKKSDLQTLEEGMSPEAVALRQQTTSTQMDQQKALQGQAQLGQITADQQKEIESLGPVGKMGVETWMRLRAEAGITATPTLKDGKPDWASIAEIGLQLGAQKMRKDDAFARLEGGHWKDATDPTTFEVTRMFFDKNNRSMDTKEKEALEAVAATPLTWKGRGEIQPATQTPVSAPTLAPAPVSAPAAPVVAPRAPQMPLRKATNGFEARGQLLAAGKIDNNMANLMSDEEAFRRAELEFPEPVVAPVGTPVAAAPAALPVASPLGTKLPAGIAMGRSPAALAGGLKAPTEAQQRAQLALSRFSQSNDMLAALEENGFDPTESISWIDSLMPEIIKSGDRKTYDAATSAWSQGLLRLESGAAIAPREKVWYEKSFFPQVGDPPSLVSQKAMMRSNLEKMVAEMAQAGGVISPQSMEQTKRIYEHAQGLSSVPAGNPGAAVQHPVIPLKSGKKVQFDEATGQYKPVP